MWNESEEQFESGSRWRQSLLAIRAINSTDDVTIDYELITDYEGELKTLFIGTVESRSTFKQTCHFRFYSQFSNS